MKTINIDLVYTDAVAPLYHRFNDALLPQPAFLQLNPANGEVSFGFRRDHVVTTAEEKGKVFCWPVPSELRGSYCPVLAEALRELLQAVQDGYYELLDDSEEYELSFVGLLDEPAQKASKQIAKLLESYLIDPADPKHVVTVYYPEDFFQDRIAEHGEIDASTTDEQLDRLARDYLEVANDSGVFIKGSLIDALTLIRDEMRESAASL
jgi:hypothetical protein